MRFWTFEGNFKLVGSEEGTIKRVPPVDRKLAHGTQVLKSQCPVHLLTDPELITLIPFDRPLLGFSSGQMAMPCKEISSGTVHRKYTRALTF